MRRSLRGLFLMAAACWCGAGQQTLLPKATAQDWKRLHTKAKTPEEFRTCAEWCRTQADGYRRKQAEYEAELKAVGERPPNRKGPKYPPSEEHVRAQIGHYRGLTKHWSDLAASYEQRAGAQ